MGKVSGPGASPSQDQPRSPETTTPDLRGRSEPAATIPHQGADPFRGPPVEVSAAFAATMFRLVKALTVAVKNDQAMLAEGRWNPHDTALWDFAEHLAEEAFSIAETEAWLRYGSTSTAAVQVFLQAEEIGRVLNSARRSSRRQSERDEKAHGRG